MTDMESCPRRVRKHVEDVILRLRRRNLSLKRLFFFPNSLPFFLNSSCIILFFHNTSQMNKLTPILSGYSPKIQGTLFLSIFFILSILPSCYFLRMVAYGLLEEIHRRKLLSYSHLLYIPK